MQPIRSNFNSPLTRPMLLRNTNLIARNNGRTAVARALIPARSVASFVPPGNHMPKPPIEVYPLFVIVAVPLCLATWIMYEKLVNDPGVSGSHDHRYDPNHPGHPIISHEHWSPDYWAL
ncbi:hypothetical protein FRC18_000789 [Serendipita sp. 400]|nr:hypothetical protein FRC18_000789 [Serendipita sp. 400]